MRAFITGITGFVGLHLAEHLHRAGDEVRGCSRGGSWPAWTSPRIAQNVPLVTWDVGAPGGVPSGLFDGLQSWGVECIYHLAALSIPKECGRDEPTGPAVAVNVEGTRRVCDLAKQLGSSPRVLFVSSSHVYGPVDADTPPLSEEAPLSPQNGYGKTKLAAEKLARDAACNDGLDVVIARAFQHTGPQQGTQMMLPEWAEQFARAGTAPVRVYNRDTQIDLTDVRDVVRAYRLLAEHGAAGETYNIGSGGPQRTGDILEILRQLADPDRPIEELSPGVRYDPIADIARLRAATGWEAKIPIEQTVADTLTFWKERTA